MVLLENDAFLIELTTLYQKSRTSGTVNLTMKKYDGRTKPTPKPDKPNRTRPSSPLEPVQHDLCLIRASNGKKKISTVVTAKDINRFQMAYTSVLRGNFDALKKRDRKKAKAPTKSPQT
ncbi:signal recognition particle 14 kDa protein-like [Styela clava]